MREERLASFPCEGPGSKRFRLHSHVDDAAVQHESSHGQESATGCQNSRLRWLLGCAVVSHGRPGTAGLDPP